MKTFINAICLHAIAMNINMTSALIGGITHSAWWLNALNVVFAVYNGVALGYAIRRAGEIWFAMKSMDLALGGT